jgi:triosephosphate isomerase
MNYLYVANWKMNMSYRASLDFCAHNLDQLNSLAHSATIILCPSFVALAPMAEILENSAVAIGAQNCSAFESGSYTGEVSASSLAEINVTYCIVGHSERRIYFAENSANIIKKIDLLYANNIAPIICIGEDKEAFLHNNAIPTLMQQLEPILTTINSYQKKKNIIIAYEPFWAIGTGIIPENKYLEEIFMWLEKFVAIHAPHCTAQLLYGGSINEKNTHQLKAIKYVDGFLIGGASTNFDTFSEIIKI